MLFQGFNGAMNYNQSSHYIQQSHAPNAGVGFHQKVTGQMTSARSSAQTTPPPPVGQQPSKYEDYPRPPSQHSESSPLLTNGLDSLSARGDDSNDSSVLSQKQVCIIYTRASNTKNFRGFLCASNADRPQRQNCLRVMRLNFVYQNILP